MKKIFKNALSLTVAMSLVIGNAPLSHAISEKDTYVALGDSISTGHKLEDIENNLFVHKIEKTYNLDLTNLAKNGMDTNQMLALLKSSEQEGLDYKKAISEADLITISMGGNNLLQPLMDMMKNVLGLDSSATGIELQAAMQKNPNSLYLLGEALKNPQATQDLYSKVELFSKEFPEIVKMIKALNPNAEIIIQTVYNPLHDVKELSALATGVDQLFYGMNQVISGYSALGYEVADVYEEFKFNDSSVALTNMQEFDVHPNKVGNEIIFNEHKKILDKEENEIEFKTLAGVNRYETAIKVSQERFNNGEANAVILVEKDAVIDGLGVAPLAISENAPILFTDFNSLSTETITEMYRVLGADFAQKTVYIVGGEEKISPTLDLMLAQKKVNVERIDGINRYETSLKIAEKLKGSSEVVFVVGGNGEADAMSISAKAAEYKAPILVLENKEINEDAKKILEGKEIYIIGGEDCLSNSVKEELDKLDKNNSSERISGLDRKETNAKVISKFYKPEEVSEIFVAKDGFGRGKIDLVDALVGAPLVGGKSSLMVLSTNDLSELQKENLKLFNNINKVTVVGNGISENTINTISNLLSNK